MQETWVHYLSREDPLEKGMATHSSILAWRIPWAEESGKLQPMGHKTLTLSLEQNLVESLITAVILNRTTAKSQAGSLNKNTWAIADTEI